VILDSISQNCPELLSGAVDIAWQQGPQKARNASFCGVVLTLAERAVPTASDMRSRHRFVADGEGPCSCRMCAGRGFKKCEREKRAVSQFELFLS